MHPSVCLAKRPVCFRAYNSALAPRRPDSISHPCPLCKRLSIQVPPARRVKLTSRHATPVGLETRIEKPGTYTVYVTASMRWTGSGACTDPSETPIRVMQFCVPESLYTNEEGHLSCCKVSPEMLDVVVRTGFKLELRWRRRVVVVVAAPAAAAAAVFCVVFLLLSEAVLLVDLFPSSSVVALSDRGLWVSIISPRA